MLDGTSFTRVDEVAGALRERVIAGTYAPGHRLVEAALTEEFASSRGVVREALRRLAAEGVLEVVPHRGAAVRRLARADLRMIGPVRATLEGLAARLAAPQGPAAQARLAASLAEQEAAEQADDPVGAFAACNLRFHALVLELAANPRLEEALRPLALPLSRLIYARLLDRTARARSRAAHGRIAAALVMADARRAAAAMEAHVHESFGELDRLPDRYLA